MASQLSVVSNNWSGAVWQRIHETLKIEGVRVLLL